MKIYLETKNIKTSYKRSLSNLEMKRLQIMREFYDAEDNLERFRRANNLN